MASTLLPIITTTYSILEQGHNIARSGASFYEHKSPNFQTRMSKVRDKLFRLDTALLSIRGLQLYSIAIGCTSSSLFPILFATGAFACAGFTALKLTEKATDYIDKKFINNKDENLNLYKFDLPSNTFADFSIDRSKRKKTHIRCHQAQIIVNIALATFTSNHLFFAATAIFHTSLLINTLREQWLKTSVTFILPPPPPLPLAHPPPTPEDDPAHATDPLYPYLRSITFNSFLLRRPPDATERTTLHDPDKQQKHQNEVQKQKEANETDMCPICIDTMSISQNITHACKRHIFHETCLVYQQAVSLGDLIGLKAFPIDGLDSFDISSNKQTKTTTFHLQIKRNKLPCCPTCRDSFCGGNLEVEIEKVVAQKACAERTAMLRTNPSYAAIQNGNHVATLSFV